MNFHFKKAFDYLKTPEGKAESILRGIIDTLKSRCINEITSFHFFTYSTEIERINTPQITTVCFSYTTNRDIRYQTFRSKTFDTKEATLILEIIEKHLTDEGYECLHDKNGFTVNL